MLFDKSILRVPSEYFLTFVVLGRPQFLFHCKPQSIDKCNLTVATKTSDNAQEGHISNCSSTVALFNRYLEKRLTFSNGTIVSSIDDNSSVVGRRSVDGSPVFTSSDLYAGVVFPQLRNSVFRFVYTMNQSSNA